MSLFEDPDRSRYDPQASLLCRSALLRRNARLWGPQVRRGLKKLGQARWSKLDPGPLWARLLSARRFRLRQELDGPRYVWWIERDIPPADLYRCAAYQVVLSVDKTRQPHLTVRTGRADYPLPQPLPASLELILEQAAGDPALIIPRKMGPAFD